MSQEAYVFAVQLENTSTGFQGDDVTMHLMRAPSNANGGGITLLDVVFTNGAATNSGTAFKLQLENWDTTGTAIKSSGGTIGSVGGTADVFAADTPKVMTLSNKFVDAGEYLVLRKTETNSSDPTRGCVMITYSMGRQT